jgi:hypothetical protein
MVYPSQYWQIWRSPSAGVRIRQGAAVTALFFDASKSGAAAGYIAFGPSPLRSVAPKKEYDMDWNAIFFAVALPFFIFGAVGLGIYVQRLPG